MWFKNGLKAQSFQKQHALGYELLPFTFPFGR